MRDCSSRDAIDSDRPALAQSFLVFSVAGMPWPAAVLDGNFTAENDLWLVRETGVVERVKQTGVLRMDVDLEVPCGHQIL